MNGWFGGTHIDISIATVAADADVRPTASLAGSDSHWQRKKHALSRGMSGICNDNQWHPCVHIVCIQYVYDMYTYVHDICTFICTHLPIFWDSWDWYPDIEEGRGESARSGCVESSANSASKGRFYLHLWQCVDLAVDCFRIPGNYLSRLAPIHT